MRGVSAEFQIVASVGTLTETYKALRSNPSATLLCCKNMHPEPGIDEALLELIESFPDTKVVVFTRFATSKERATLMVAGVKDVICTLLGPDDFLRRLRAVSEGEILAENEIEKVRTYLTSDEVVRDAAFELNPEESRVLRCLSLGLVDIELCVVLQIGLDIGQSHFHSLLSKMGKESKEAGEWLAERDKNILA